LCNDFGRVSGQWTLARKMTSFGFPKNIFVRWVRFKVRVGVNVEVRVRFRVWVGVNVEVRVSGKPENMIKYVFSRNPFGQESSIPLESINQSRVFIYNTSQKKIHKMNTTIND